MKNLSLAAIALLSTASTIVPAADPSGTTRQELAIGHALNGFPRIRALSELIESGIWIPLTVGL
jgi:hypothetical protein